MKDVLFNAILVAANEALLEIAEVSDEERKLVEGWAGRGRKGLEKCWDDKLNLCLDYDLRADKPLRARILAGFAAPLVASRQSPELLAALLGDLDSTAFAGHPELRWPVPPSTSPKERGFHPRSYCLCKSENTKCSELGFSAVLGNGVAEVRFERATLS